MEDLLVGGGSGHDQPCPSPGDHFVNQGLAPGRGCDCGLYINYGFREAADADV